MPRGGKYCLELEALPESETATARMVPTAPVWITSAPISAKAGELIVISGYVRVPENLLNTVDGLQIMDSLGGPEMAHRFTLAQSWQNFRLLRVARNDTEVSVTIALTGLGKAQVDDLTIHTLKMPPASSPLQATRMQQYAR